MFPNYAELVSEKSLKNFPQSLQDALCHAEKKFSEILDTPREKQNFSSVVEKFFESQTNLSELFTFINNYNSTNSSDAVQKIIENFQPKYIAYGSTVSMSKKFFVILNTITQTEKKLNPEQTRSLQVLITDMQMSGVGLEDTQKSQLEKINIELAELTENFSQNALKSRKIFSYHFEEKKFLEEIPEQELSEAKKIASTEKKSGYIFTLSPPLVSAILKYCSSSDIRQKFYEANVSVATTGKYDNKPLAHKILLLRQQKSELLGKKNFAEYIFQQRMAQNPDQVLELLEDVVQKSKPVAEQEFSELEAFAGQKLEPWDIGYYAEKLRKEKFSLDEKELQKFFPYAIVRKGLFTIAEKIFGITFTKLDIDSYDPSVTTYLVSKKSTQEVLGYYLLDPFTRETKRAGAWCNNFRDKTPIMVNVMNFPKGKDEENTLLTHRDVETLFHEFGHATHMLLGGSTLSNTTGFETEWDFVELPSQLLENWCWQDESLALMTEHIQTKEKISPQMITALKASKNFGSGMHVLRQNEFSLLDLRLHCEKIPDSVESLDTKCKEIGAKYSIIPKPEYSRMYCSFTHIFAGGYAAGYYSYLWAEILEADVFQEFLKAGILDSSIGEKYIQKIIFPGSIKSGSELFFDFMGRDPEISAYLKKVGLGE